MSLINWKRYLPWMLVILLAVILFTRKTETITVKVPEKTGQFERDSTELKPIEYDTIIVEGQKEVVKVENPVNQDLLKQYQSLKDSVAKLDFVTDKITERTYKENYTDNQISIEVESKTIGRLIDQKISYTIPAQEIETKVKTQKYHLYGGISTIIKPTPEPSINLHLTSPKMIFTVGFEPINSGINVGISRKIF